MESFQCDVVHYLTVGISTAIAYCVLFPGGAGSSEKEGDADQKKQKDDVADELSDETESISGEVTPAELTDTEATEDYTTPAQGTEPQATGTDATDTEDTDRQFGKKDLEGKDSKEDINEEISEEKDEDKADGTAHEDKADATGDVKPKASDEGIGVSDNEGKSEREDVSGNKDESLPTHQDSDFNAHEPGGSGSARRNDDNVSELAGPNAGDDLYCLCEPKAGADEDEGKPPPGKLSRFSIKKTPEKEKLKKSRKCPLSKRRQKKKEKEPPYIPESEKSEPEPKEPEPKVPEPKEPEPKEPVPKESAPKESEPKESEPKESEPKESEPESKVTEPSKKPSKTKRKSKCQRNRKKEDKQKDAIAKESVPATSAGKAEDKKESVPSESGAKESREPSIAESDKKAPGSKRERKKCSGSKKREKKRKEKDKLVAGDRTEDPSSKTEGTGDRVEDPSSKTEGTRTLPAVEELSEPSESKEDVQRKGVGEERGASRHQTSRRDSESSEYYDPLGFIKLIQYLQSLDSSIKHVLVMAVGITVHRILGDESTPGFGDGSRGIFDCIGQ